MCEELKHLLHTQCSPAQEKTQGTFSRLKLSPHFLQKQVVKIAVLLRLSLTKFL